MKVALAQINATVGDLAGNVDLCVAAVKRAQAQGADLVVLPEMAIPGYPPRDILFDPSFTSAITAATHDLAEQLTAAPPTVVGTAVPASDIPPHAPAEAPRLHNAAVLLHAGTVQTVATKQLLPAYDVFFEPRWFQAGTPAPPIPIAGHNVGVLLCEDMWDEGYAHHPGAQLRAQGATHILCLSASPYRTGIMEQRLYHARRQGCPLVYVNMYGGNDELIFDGRSFVLDAAGNQLAQLPSFTEAVQVVDMHQAPLPPPTSTSVEQLYRALVLGIRDFARKNGISRAYVGLSGGIDSAVVAALAVAALGSKRVTAVAMPSRYTDPRSTETAHTLAKALGMAWEVVPIEPLHAAAEATLQNLLEPSEKGNTTAENVQARLRGMILMAFVNRYGGMLLNTSNKTELSLGYATLYGDMAGTLCPLADVTKPDVYALARWINAQRDAVIPEFMLSRPPSAELRPGQVDPFNYETVAPAMERLVQANQSNGYLRRSEHKRWQMGVVLKVSEKAFGTGRMIPITRQ